ncbi:MAG: hypothetical protein PWP24_1857, partial [Clostridiales bacterium]|nr:hypothetical protein [Clostridiales bacterium]
MQRNKGFYYAVFLTLMGIVFILVMLFLTRHGKTSVVKSGSADLSSWDFDLEGNVKLDGGWEFYWNQLIKPEEFDQARYIRTGYYKVPMYWTKYSKLGLPSKGNATYRLVIKTKGKEHTLSLKTPEIYTEYCLWINGQAVDGNGSLWKGGKKYLKPNVYTFSTSHNQVEIVLQIKNNSHINAGLGQSFLLGTPNHIYENRMGGVARDIIVMTICFLVGIYHMILYGYRRYERSLIYLAMIAM